MNEEQKRQQDKDATYILLNRVTQWTREPTTVDELVAILGEYQDVHLVAGVLIFSNDQDKAVARILWCELAKRRGLFEFEMHTTTTKGVPTELHFKAKAKAVSTVKLREHS